MMDRLDIWNEVDDPLAIVPWSTSRCRAIGENTIRFIAELLWSALQSELQQDKTYSFDTTTETGDRFPLSPDNI